MSEKFSNGNKTEETKRNNQVFKKKFYYWPQSFLKKDLHKNNKIKNCKITKYINDSLIDLRNHFGSKEITENEIPNSILNLRKKPSILMNKKKINDSKY